MITTPKAINLYQSQGLLEGFLKLGVPFWGVPRIRIMIYRWPLIWESYYFCASFRCLEVCCNNVALTVMLHRQSAFADPTTFQEAAELRATKTRLTTCTCDFRWDHEPLTLNPKTASRAQRTSWACLFRAAAPTNTAEVYQKLRAPDNSFGVDCHLKPGDIVPIP